MFIRHPKIAAFLMTLLTMITFTATAYMFDSSQASPPVMAQYDSSDTLTNAISEASVFSHTLELVESVDRITQSERRQKNRVTSRQLAHQAHQLAPIKPRKSTIKRPRLERLRDSTYTTTQTNQSPPRPAITCTVTTTTDSGADSLRQCLLDAVVSDTINFDPQIFSPTAPATITLSTPLPWITTDGLTIDGSQAGVVLDGSQLSEGHGLVFTGTNGIKVQGLQILNFPGIGIGLIEASTNAIIGGETEGARNLISGNSIVGIQIQDEGTSGNQVLGNYIGTDKSGTIALGNTDGILIANGAQNNLIGGETEGARNLISGNMDDGVQIQNEGTSGNQVLGNYIGTDTSGAIALGNGEDGDGDGVSILAGAHGNFIGGTEAGTGNLISGNTNVGVWIQDPGTNDNRVQGNYIGTNASGTAPLGNTSGVLIKFGAQGNLVGGETEGEGNLISGNVESGIWIQEEGTNGNQIQGNYIGTDESGTVALSNTDGILIGFGAQNNLIGGETEGARNLISGNMDVGVQIQNDGTTNNQVLGNYIGTDAKGSASLGNVMGILIGAGAQNNIIGGLTEGFRNVISGNIEAGIQLQNAGTTNNQVQGNYIGTNLSGINPLGNSDGIVILEEAQENLIGDKTEGARNVISGNMNNGIDIQGSGTSANEVLGNYIGTDVSGTAPLGNGDGVFIGFGAQGNIIGGESANLISGNRNNGVDVQHKGTDGNQVLSNYIGTNVSGTTPISNTDGIFIGFGAQENTVGENLISGNIVGIQLQEPETTGNQVFGNYIGTDFSGTTAVGNEDGIVISGAQENFIGGSTEEARNLISGNQIGVRLQADTSSNKIQGNYIGTNAIGTAAVTNAIGIAMGSGERGVQNNFVEDNLISGNDVGIVLLHEETTNNQVQGNYIGTNATGTKPLANVFGIAIVSGAYNNLIGGQKAGEGNLISGNVQVGIQIQDEGTIDNQVQGNRIGSNMTGTVSISNTIGVLIKFGAQQNIIGGTGSQGNLISGNLAGVWLGNETGNQDPKDENTNDNQVQGNYIGTDATGMKALNNLVGVVIGGGVQNNLVGGTGNGEDNLISGNIMAGIQIQQESTSGNQVQGNYIGTSVDGMAPLGNGWGIGISSGAQDNLVGGEIPAARNLISGNTEDGVRLQNEETSGNQVQGNYIGLNVEGAPLGNNSNGVYLSDAATLNTIGISNTIAYNGEAGVKLDSEITGNTITRNSIHHNNGSPIDPILAIDPPLFTSYSSNTLSGGTCDNCRIEIFANPDEEPAGTIFLAEVIADNEGAFSVMLSDVPTDMPCLSATVTDIDGTTLSFSSSLCEEISPIYRLHLPVVLH